MLLLWLRAVLFTWVTGELTLKAKILSFGKDLQTVPQLGEIVETKLDLDNIHAANAFCVCKTAYPNAITTFTFKSPNATLFTPATTGPSDFKDLVGYYFDEVRYIVVMEDYFLNFYAIPPSVEGQEVYYQYVGDKFEAITANEYMDKVLKRIPDISLDINKPKSEYLSLYVYYGRKDGLVQQIIISKFNSQIKTISYENETIWTAPDNGYDLVGRVEFLNMSKTKLLCIIHFTNANGKEKIGFYTKIGTKNWTTYTTVFKPLFTDYIKFINVDVSLDQNWEVSTEEDLPYCDGRRIYKVVLPGFSIIKLKYGSADLWTKPGKDLGVIAWTTYINGEEEYMHFRIVGGDCILKSLFYVRYNENTFQRVNEYVYTALKSAMGETLSTSEIEPHSASKTS